MRFEPVKGFGGRYFVSDNGTIYLRDGRAVSARLDREGYAISSLWDGKRYHTVRVGRIVLQTFTGFAPSDKPVADHINRVRSADRLINLRWSSHSDNNRNRVVPSASGVKGVCLRKGKPNPWQAYAVVGGKFKSLGHFPTLEEAALARQTHDEGLAA